MDYNLEKVKAQKTYKKFIIFISIFIGIVVFGGFIMFGIFVLAPDKGHYIGDIISYDNVDIVVNDVSEKPYTGKNFNGYTLTVNFSMKNNNSSEFNFNFDDIYIKLENSSSKYERNLYLGDELSVFVPETLIPGGNYNFSLSYNVPYSLTKKNYVIYFDLKHLHSISQCNLYKKQ